MNGKYKSCFFKNSLIGLGVGVMGVLIMCSCHRNKEIATANRPSPKPITQVTVCAQGSTNSIIVLSEKPTTSAQYAALELQYHLEKITGVKVPIVREPVPASAPIQLCVGNTQVARAAGFPVDSLAPGEFLIAATNNTLILAGGDDPATDDADWNKSMDQLAGFTPRDIGTCYAVYEFLEKYCQVHWYLPAETGMVYPVMDQLTVYIKAPTRRRTDFRATSMWPPYVNGNMFWLPGSPPLKPGDILPLQEVGRWKIRNKVGGEPYSPNHSFGNWITCYGNKHPDWFSYKSENKIKELFAKGPAEAEKQFQLTGQPCLIANGVLEQSIANAGEFFKNGDKSLNPHTASYGRFFSIVMNDNTAMCACSKCANLYNRRTVIPGDGSASYYFWNFVNQVAGAIRKDYPDKWVSSLAYFNYTVPPQDLVLEPNVAVSICNTQGNWTLALREPAYRLLDAWRNSARAQWLGLWEYNVFQKTGATGMPRCAPKFTGEDARQVFKRGALAEFIEGETCDPEFEEAYKKLNSGWVWLSPIRNYLNIWIRFKMWDDTKQNIDTLLQDHYRLFYGPAAKPIQRFYELIEARVTDMSLRGAETFTNERSLNPAIDWDYLCPPPVMKELRSAIDEATKMAVEDPYRTRAAWVRQGIMEAMEQDQQRYLEEKKKTKALSKAQMICYRLPQVPPLDGTGNSPVWDAVPVAYLNDSKTGESSALKTTFRLGYDDDNLYLLCRCPDPDIDRIRIKGSRDLRVWEDDCIELFLCGNPANRAVFHHFIINARGTVYDAIRNEQGEDISWNCPGLVARTQIDKQGYTVEVKVPLHSLGCPKPANSLMMYGNVCREKYSRSNNSMPDALLSWCPAPDGFCEMNAFGRILFSEGDAWRLFFTKDTSLPSAVLYTVDSSNKWKATTGGITASPRDDHVHYDMEYPADPNIRSVIGCITFLLKKPIDVSNHPYVEIRFENQNLKMEMSLVYSYLDEQGKEYSSFFVFYRKPSEISTAQTFIWDINKGNYPNLPKPRHLTKVAVYATAKSGEGPIRGDFSLYYVRCCRETMRGSSPQLIPADWR